jgi:hypothetical protein
VFYTNTIPLEPSSKVILLIDSFANMTAPGTQNDPTTYGQQHKYSPLEEVFSDMKYTHNTIPFGFECKADKDEWCPASKVDGIARTPSIRWKVGSWQVFAIIANPDVSVEKLD